jgi:hypothetical protein
MSSALVLYELYGNFPSPPSLARVSFRVIKPALPAADAADICDEEKLAVENPSNVNKEIEKSQIHGNF